MGTSGTGKCIFLYDQDHAIPVRMALEAAKLRGQLEINPVGNQGAQNDKIE